MEGPNRGQSDPFWMSTMVIIMLAIVPIVVITAFQTMKNLASRTSPGDVENLCAGVFGCGGPSVTQAAGFVAIAVVMIVAHWWLSNRVPDRSGE